MAAPIDGMLKDGNLEFSGGVDSDSPPSFLARNKVARATNSTFRGGKSAPRPGFVKRDLVWDNTDDKYDFQNFNFQHSGFFDGSGVPMLISSHGGRLWKTDVATNRVTEITPSTGRNSATLKRGWSVQAENYFIYQDNQGYPIIFDGSAARRADPSLSQVPVGNIMCYAMGRLAVTLPDRQSFRIGDLVFGPSGSVGNNYRDAILYFTENNFLNEGGDLIARVFGAPSAYGPITCMKAVAMENTQLGQGPMIIGTPNVMFTAQLPFDRTTWKNLANPLLTVNPIIGPISQDGTVLINADLWYRSLDGIRSYIIGLRDFNAGWGNTPQSAEVNETLSYDTENLLEFGSGVLFDNRLMHTVSPAQSPHGVWHRGLAVVDFNLISRLTSSANPAWEGIWTGLRILKIITGLVNQKPHCFVWALSDADTIELWEMDLQRRHDGNNTPIVRSMDLPSYNCGDGFAMKRLDTGELFIDEVRGDFSINVLYRSDQNPCWQPWDSFSSCAADRDCSVGTPTCRPPSNSQPQFRSKLKLHTPADAFDKINQRMYRTGYEFQPRLECTGDFDIKQLRIGAFSEPEGSHGERRVI